MVALADLGLVNRDVMEGYFGVAVSHTSLPALQDLESIDVMRSQSGEVYPLAYFGVAQLLKDLPLSTIDDYYTAIGQGDSFAQAFETAFGLTPEQFYAEFAQFRANQLPMTDHFPEELQIAAGVDQPSAVNIEDAPVFVIPGEQSLVVAEALPGTNCTLDLTVSEATMAIDDRASFADGVGQVFWLLTIPDDVESGPGSFVVTCGADPLTIPVVVT